MITKEFQEDCRVVEEAERARYKVGNINEDYVVLGNKNKHFEYANKCHPTYHIITQLKDMSGPTIPNLFMHFKTYSLHGKVSLYRLLPREVSVWLPSLTHPFKRTFSKTNYPERIFGKSLTLAGEDLRLGRFIEMLQGNITGRNEKGIEELSPNLFEPIFSQVYSYYQNILNNFLKNRGRPGEIDEMNEIQHLINQNLEGYGKALKYFCR